MKKSLAKTIAITSVVFVIFSLVVFISITIIIYSTSMQKNINKQLIIENKISYNLLMLDKLDEPAMYKFLTESQNLIYTKFEGDDNFTLIYTTDTSFDTIDIEKVLKDYITKGEKVIKYELLDKRYLMTISTNRQIEKKSDSIIISLISTEEIYDLTNRFILIMILIAFFFSCISIYISSIIAKRITEPVLKVIDVTKEYANRNFAPKYIATSQDEIQELSISVNKMALSLQSYDHEKEKLFRTISHEIKTPLTAIYGYAEGMKNGLFKDFDKPLNVIMNESMRIKTMTEDYIFLSKLESKVEIFEFSLCDIPLILERAINTIESMAIVNDIEIDYEPIVVSKVRVDEDKLYRAFLNILTNSLKYTKNRIILSLKEQENNLIIRIEDNGEGLQEEAIENFYQGLSSEKNNGSGVGLFITDAIIKNHNGIMNLGNNTGKGAFFEIILKTNNDQL